jgi:hypothetical protein
MPPPTTARKITFGIRFTSVQTLKLLTSMVLFCGRKPGAAMTDCK